MDASIAVELRSVTKRYGSVVAVRDVSLAIRENEFISLLGPSGCGKSTILRMVGGFENPDEGDILLMGISVSDVPPHRRNTNMIFQNLALFPHLSVFDNIAFGQRMKGIDRNTIRSKVEKILELVKLSGFGSRAVRQLSGGQQQRVAIARALINEPKVLLLDEPLAALDLQLRVHMQLELKQIQRRVGTTFVFVTHDQTEALTMSDRIALMRAGVVEQVGPPRAVYESPRTRFVATFLGDSNLLTGTVREIDGNDAIIIAAEQILRVSKNESIRLGDVVDISIRPEKIKIMALNATSDRSFDNSCKGTVQRVTFKGPLIEYQVVTDFGVTLTSLTTADTGAVFSEGERIIPTWEKGDSIIVAA